MHCMASILSDVPNILQHKIFSERFAIFDYQREKYIFSKVLKNWSSCQKTIYHFSRGVGVRTQSDKNHFFEPFPKWILNHYLITCFSNVTDRSHKRFKILIMDSVKLLKLSKSAGNCVLVSEKEVTFGLDKSHFQNLNLGAALYLNSMLHQYFPR